MEPIRAAIDDWRPILKARAAGAPGRAWRPGGAAAAAGLEPLGRAPGGCGDSAGLARRGAGAGAAGGAAGPGGGVLPDRGVHARPGPRAPAVRRRQGGDGGRPGAGSSSGRGALAAAGRRRRLRRRSRRGVPSGREPVGRPGCPRRVAPVFKRLEATGVEVSAICDLFEDQFPETRATLLDGGKATEEALRQRAGKYRYVHLATHGYFAPPELRSALGPSDPAARRRTDLFGPGEWPGSIRGCSRAWHWPGPTSGPPRSGRMTAS